MAVIHLFQRESFITPIASTQTAPTGNETRVDVKDRVTDDLHTAGRTVHVTDEVTGDVAAAGAEVTIDGPVDGYVMSAGRSVALEGRVGLRRGRE